MAYPCPSCDRKFDSQRGVRSHHAQVHGEKLRDYEECTWCGEDTLNTENSEKTFCDRDCYAEWQAEFEGGENHPSWEGGNVSVECQRCGGEIERKPSQVEGKNFCDRDCHAEYMAKNNNGSDHPNAEGGEVECAWCGDDHYRSPSTMSASNHFCSVRCKGQHMSVHRTGENHPRFTGGRVNYGEGWNYEKKELVRERDNRVCQSCGMTTIQHKLWCGRKLNVHHIQKARDFDDAEKRNSADNLVALCNSCHKEWEKLTPLRPQ